MAETTQTSAATAAAQTQANRVSEDSLSTLKSLEKKMESITSSLSGMNARVNELSDTLVQPGSRYFTSMADILSSSMMGIENERRIYDEAMKQNEEARRLSKGTPERGQAGFWEAAFTPQQASPTESYVAAMKATFSNDDVLSAMKKSFGLGSVESETDKETAQVIKSAIKGNADDRTFGEKALDKIGLGGINSLKNWIKDWDVRKEEKANAKDEGLIKREEKEMKRLRSLYRKMKGSGASDEDLEQIRSQIDYRKQNQQMAAERIRERRNDDLVEISDKSPAGLGQNELAKNAEKSILEELNSVLKAFNAETANKTREENSGAPGSKESEPANNAEVLGKALKSAMSEMNTGNTADAVVIGQERPEQTSVKKLTGDNNEPVELGEGKKSTVDMTDSAKEAADIQRRLDTQMRPDFYRMGTEFFKKGNDGSLFNGLKSAFTSGLAGLGGGLLKGGLYGALTVATVAAVGNIINAGDALVELFKVKRESTNTTVDMMESNAQTSEERAKTMTYKKDMMAAQAESFRVDAEMTKRYGNEGYNAAIIPRKLLEEFGNRELSEDNYNHRQEMFKFLQNNDLKQFWSGQGVDDLIKILKTYQKYDAEKKKTAEFIKSARANGIGLLDVEGLNQYKDKYDADKKAAKEAEFAQFNESLQFKWDPNAGFALPGQQKMASGNLTQTNAPNAAMPGVEADPAKAETAEEQAKRMEEATYQGTKRALMDEQVKQQNEETAKLQGQQLNESLVGRK